MYASETGLQPEGGPIMVHVAQATEHDFPQVHSLFLEYLQWVIPIVEGVWGFPIGITAVAFADHEMADIQRFMPPDGRLLLASDDSGMIGCACARTIHAGLAEIKRVYVRPSGRGSGTGRALIQRILVELRDAGYTSVRLETGTFMPAAQKLYRSLGFKDIAPYEESETPADQRQHAMFFELTL